MPVVRPNDPVKPRPTDPNATRNRAANTEKSLSYPIGEDLPMTTRMKFVTYHRFDPAVTGQEITSTLITLPLPMNIADRSGIKTSSQDLWTIGNVDLSHLTKGIDMASWDTLKNAWETGTSLATDSLKRMDDHFKTSALKALALSPVLGDDTRRSLSGLAGVVQNPHTNLVFEGVQLRRHSFTWRMSARSQQESDRIKEISDLIKQRSHPAEAFRGFALDYPDLVYVEFTGDAGKYLPKIRKSMIDEVDIKTTGSGGGISMYKSGAPVEVELTVSMQEINIVTRDQLEADG